MSGNLNSIYFFSTTKPARFIFIILYALSNIYAYYMMKENGRYVGDFGFTIENNVPLFTLLCLVLISYLIVCGPLYSFLVKIKTTSICLSGDQKIIYIGRLVLVIQTLYFIFNVLTGSNLAGGDAKSGGLARFVWFIIPVDYIFYIYYMMARGRCTTLCRVNFLIFMLSQLSRGWLGWVLIILYIEICFYLSNRARGFKLSYFVYAVFLIPALTMLPVLFYLKVALREALSNQDLIDLFFMLKHLDAGLIFTSFFDSFFYRLQHLSNVAFIYENVENIKNAIESSNAAPFYWEGLIPQAIGKAISLYPGEDIHLFLYTEYISSLSDAETTLQTGFVSWFLLEPTTGIIYILYVFLLLFISVFLSKKIGGVKLCALTWFFVLLYIMNGWFNAFLFYIQALIIVFFIMKIRFPPNTM